MKNDANNTSRQDVYSRITSQIVARLALCGAELELILAPMTVVIDENIC